MKLGTRSRERLDGVHTDLIIVFATAISSPKLPFDFTVLEGTRLLTRQKKLVASGASTTMKSRHLESKVTGYSHAVDIAPYIDGEVRWDWPLYDKLGIFIKEVAKDCDIPIEWGGDWKSFKDGPHWQLPWKLYP